MNKKQKSLTNKGFSLVELIIVIAIMAVLVGVLAPQFLKYVERSRKATDVDNIQSVITAIQVYAADPAVASADKIVASKNATLTFETGGLTVGGDNSTNVTKALTEASLTASNIKMKSEAYKSIEITITVDAEGVPSFSVANTELATQLGIKDTTPTTTPTTTP